MEQGDTESRTSKMYPAGRRLLSQILRDNDEVAAGRPPRDKHESLRRDTNGLVGEGHWSGLERESEGRRQK